MSRKQLIVLLTVLVIFIVMVFTILNLRLRENEIKKMANEIERTITDDVNQKFLQAFFTYKTSKERYENIEPLMTSKGYKLSYPSGDELPTSDQSIKSKLSELVSYEHQISKTESEFYNEFSLETTFNELDSKRKILIYTKIKYIDGDWLVDDVEYVTDLEDQ